MSRYNERSLAHNTSTSSDSPHLRSRAGRGEGVDDCLEDQVVEVGGDGTVVVGGGRTLTGVVGTMNTGGEEEGVEDTIVADGRDTFGVSLLLAVCGPRRSLMGNLGMLLTGTVMVKSVSSRESTKIASRGSSRLGGGEVGWLLLEVEVSVTRTQHEYLFR